MNFDEIVVKESPGLCRCCLSEGCYKDLGSEYLWMNDTEVYADMLLDCFDIGITQHTDGPNGAKRLICEVCITRLRDACNFKKQVLDSEKRFINMLGRGEFRPKVLIYQQSRELKAENDEPSEDLELTEDPEYLEELDYFGDEEVIKTEDYQSTSLATTSEDSRLPKAKRGRPRKEDDKSAGSKVAKKPKVSKGSIWSHTQDSLVEKSDDEVKDPQKVEAKLTGLRGNVTQVVMNSTVVPFRWLSTSYRCFFCYDVFTEASELKAHNVLHEREEIKTAMNKYWENDVFVDVGNCSCLHCNQSYNDLDDLIDHLIAEHDVEYDRNTTQCFKPFILTDDAVICGICTSKSDLFSQALLHATKEHRNPKDYICNECGRSFNKLQYKIHTKNAHRKKMVNCTYCGQMYSSSKLRTHMIREHNKKVRCTMCEETFMTHYKRQQHMVTVHRSRRSFKCPDCTVTFYYRSTLNRHIREVHQKVWNFICSFCGWTGYSASRLKVHMLSHSRVRDVPCVLCNKMFKSSKYLKQHIKVSHSDEH